jgi:hypothetical protein
MGEWRYSSTILTSAIDGGKWSVSRLSRFTLEEGAASTHWIGDWVGPRAGLDTVECRKISCFCRESNPAVQPVVIMSQVSRFLVFYIVFSLMFLSVSFTISESLSKYSQWWDFVNTLMNFSKGWEISYSSDRQLSSGKRFFSADLISPSLVFGGPDSCTIQVMTSNKDQSLSGTRQKRELRSFDITKWRQTTRCLFENPVHLALKQLPTTSCNIYRSNCILLRYNAADKVYFVQNCT